MVITGMSQGLRVFSIGGIDDGALAQQVIVHGRISWISVPNRPISKSQMNRQDCQDEGLFIDVGLDDETLKELVAMAIWPL